LAAQYGAANRLPVGVETFDFFDEASGLAICAKTIDTVTDAKLANPKSVYSSIKKDIDKVIDFEGGLVILSAHEIQIKRLEVAIPEGTTPTQMAELARAVDYAKLNDVEVVITKVK
jgi:filamentous hemagglutinin